MAEETAERPISTSATLLVFEPTAVVVEGLSFRIVLGFSSLLLVLVCVVDLLPLDIELAQLIHIINHLVAHFHAFPRLIERILVAVDLGEDGAVLQLQFSNYEDLPHPVGNALLL